MCATMDRYKKKKEDDELAAALHDFQKDFGDGPRTDTKAFIRADVVNANKSLGVNQPGEVYRPKPNALLELAAKKPNPSTANSFEEAKKLATERAKKMLEEAARSKGIAAPVVVPASNRLRPPKPGANKTALKSKTSNLEAFKEELRMQQEEREKRRGLRDHLTKNAGLDSAAVDRIAPSLDNPYLMGRGGEYDSDTDTTNLYVCNLPLDIKMEELLDTFGSYGPLASARILYPRSEAERVRDHLCGFIGFMSRFDVERAMANLQGLVIRKDPIKFSLAKPVVIPQQPFYVPPTLAAYAFPDPPTGLPFNAKPRSTDLKAYIDNFKQLPECGSLPKDEKACVAFKQMLKNAVVRVVIPTDSTLIAIIHRTIEFVILDGPIFEKILLDNQGHNELFQFLWNYHHPAHVYYRWKLFSVLQGDDTYNWRKERFRMFEEGSWWDPPIPAREMFSAMPKSLYHTCYTIERSEDTHHHRDDRDDRTSRKRKHSENEVELRERDKRRKNRLRGRDRDKLEDILRHLTPEKKSIANAMVWCVDHASAAKEIVECIAESLSIDETPLHKKIARLYLIADILANSALRGVRDVFYFRQYFEGVFQKIFVSMGRALKQITARLKVEQFKQRVMACFQSWESAAVYSTEMLIHNQNVFLGLVEVHDSDSSSSSSEDERESANHTGVGGRDSEKRELDDIDGVPLEQAEKLKNDHRNMSIYSEEDMRDVKPTGTGSFKPVAWAEVDPNKLPSPEPAKSKWDNEEDEKTSVVPSKWERVEISNQEREGGRYNMDSRSSKSQDSGPYKWDRVHDLGGPLTDAAPVSKWEEDDSPSSGSPSKDISKGSHAASPGRSESRGNKDSKKEIEKLKEKMFADLKVKVDSLRRQLEEDGDLDVADTVGKFEKEQREKIERQLGDGVKKKDRKKRDDKDKKRDKSKDKSERERRRSRSRSPRRRSRSRSRENRKEREKERVRDRRRNTPENRRR